MRFNVKRFGEKSFLYSKNIESFGKNKTIDAMRFVIYILSRIKSVNCLVCSGSSVPESVRAAYFIAISLVYDERGISHECFKTGCTKDLVGITQRNFKKNTYLPWITRTV